MFSCKIWEIFKSTYSYRTPPVAVSVLLYILVNFVFVGNMFEQGYFKYVSTIESVSIFNKNNVLLHFRRAIK